MSTDSTTTGSPSARQRWIELFDNLDSLARLARPNLVHGRLSRATGMVVEATGLRLPVGSICRIRTGDADPVPTEQSPGEGERARNTPTIDAEVVGFAHGRLLLMPATPVHGLAPGASVTAIEHRPHRPALGQPSHAWQRTGDRGRHLPLGDGLLGRVVDAQGMPVDGRGPLEHARSRPIRGRPINAMHRTPITTPLATGVRAIDTLLTVGRGQRLGLFAGAGVGKSVLMGMMARHTEADVIVVGLIGERGREVREFIDDILGSGARERAAVVVAPADEPALMKLQAAHYATAIAEHFRAQGLRVLLLMDSLTRYAMALREIALAIGEPPATRGYPPSVFARLPELIERAGNGDHGQGSITAFYTVLIEGDDPNDPVGDAARSFLDGHVVLSRDLAEAGHFPAIDIERSISRVMTAIVAPQRLAAARALRAAWGRWQRNRDLVTLGAYASGNDPALDRALAAQPAMQAFLCQEMEERADTEASWLALIGLSGSLEPA